MAGTVAVTVTPLPDAQMTKYDIAWDTLGTGGVSGHSAALAVIQPGYVQQFQADPKPSGGAPLGYAIDLLDADGVSALAVGFQLSIVGSLGTRFVSAAPVFYDGSPLDLVVSLGDPPSIGVLSVWIGRMDGQDKD